MKNSCAWFVRSDDEGSSSSGCIEKDKCNNDSEIECFTTNTITHHTVARTCGASCGATNKSCDDCVNSKNGAKCAWHVRSTFDTVNHQCVSKGQCHDKGFEKGSCIRNKIKNNQERTCQVINKPCENKTTCKKCLNFGRKGANCGYWVGQDKNGDQIRKCIGLEQCNSQEDSGECVQKDAFSTKESNKQTCNFYDGNMPPPPPPQDNCKLQYSCDDCSKNKGCSWSQDYYLDKCGFDRSVCRAEVNATIDICPVRAPSCEATFPDLVGMPADKAKESLGTEYGTGTFCIYQVLKGDPVTEDYRCDRIRLFVDTKAIVVDVPRVK